MQPICALSDIPDPGTREFSLTVGEWPVPGFLVRYHDEVRAFLNRCPHAGHLLNWRADGFFAPESELLLCTSHGARFNPLTGLCVEGPCIGSSLQAIDTVVIDGKVVLTGDAAPIIAAFWGNRLPTGSGRQG